MILATLAGELHPQLLTISCTNALTSDQKLKQHNAVSQPVHDTELGPTIHEHHVGFMDFCPIDQPYVPLAWNGNQMEKLSVNYMPSHDWNATTSRYA
jgi:hypothetical protein